MEDGKRANPSQSWRIGKNIMYSRLFRGSVAFTILGIFYLSLFVSDQHVNVFSVVGGIAGLISTVIVVTGYSTSNNKAFSTLFWRAMCDLGVALRFVLVPAFNYYTCGSSVCAYDNTHENLCQLPSAILQFFLLASEMWFFCHGLDLYFTVNNPFSSYESRVWKYHVFTWGMALFITIFPYISDTVSTAYGFWYISDSDSNADYPVCWLKIKQETDLGWPIYVLFFMPLAIVYMFCLMTVILAYVRLRKGLTQSFLPRVKLLVTSISNIVVLILFWGVAMMIYGLTYQLRNNKQASDKTFNILMFMIASKAFSSLVVAINQVDYYKKDDSLSGIEGDDANTALREEVLSFATAGIKNTAMSTAEKGTTVFTRQPRLTNYRSTKTLVTPWFFFRLLFDHDGEGLRAVKDMLEKNKRTMHGSNNLSHGLNLSEEETKSLLSSQHSQGRLSQRSTLTTNPSIVHSPFVPFSANTAADAASANNTYEDPTNNHTIRRSSASSAGIHQPNNTQSAMVGIRDQYASSDIRPGSEVASFAMMKESDMVDVEAAKLSSASGAKRQNLSRQMCVSILRPLINLFENDTVEFRELQPYYFQQIRHAYGVSKDLYADEFSKSIKQRMTEGGASGAFFFFSKTDKFVGKSCTEEEMDVLVANAQTYSEYMTKNPTTFICKIYGVYELRIYNEVLYFFVMNNLFLNEDGLTMNEKYDLKGSWVSRNSAPPRDGQTFSCTYCERKFVYRKKRRNVKRAVASSSTSYQRTPSSTTNESVDELTQNNSNNNNKEHPAMKGLSSLFAGMFGNNTSSNSSSGSNHLSSSRSSSPSPSNKHTSGTANNHNNVHSSSSNSSTGSDKGNKAAMKGQDAVELHDLSMDHGLSQLAFGGSNQNNLLEDDRCPFTTGEHYPNVIMKDNDIKHKIRLTEAESLEVQSQLRMDADFLTSLGIMDYSLLVGVHIAEYEVDQTQAEFAPASPSPSPSPRNAGNNNSNNNSSNDKPINISQKDPYMSTEESGGLSMMSKQRSFVRRTATMSKKNFDAINANATGTEVTTGESMVSKMAAAVEASERDLEAGGGEDGGVSVSSASSKVKATPAADGYKLTRKLAVHKIIGPDAYFMGIIDFQQRWNFSKRMERFFKIFFKGADPEGLSAIEPPLYKERFLRKIEDILEQESAVRYK